jgi:hypothetical protein
MKKALVERNLVILLFATVLIVFTFAQRDTQKLIDRYNTKSMTVMAKKAGDVSPSPELGQNKLALKQTRN